MLAIEGDGRRSLDETRVLVPGLAASAAVGVAIALLPVTQVPAVALVILAIGVGMVGVAGIARALTVTGAIAYVAALQWAFVDWVVPIYTYSGLISVGVEWPDLLIVTSVCVLPAVWLPMSLERPSDIVLWFLYLFGYVPACAIPIHLLGPGLWPVLPFLGLVAGAFAILGLVHRIPPLSSTWSGLSERSFSRVLVGAGLGAIAYLIVVFGVPRGLPSFETVYDARAAYAAVADQTAGAGYFVPWAGSVIFPLLVAYGLARSRVRLLTLGIAGELLVYGTTGFKTVLFSIVLVPLLFLAIRFASRRLGILLIWSGGAMILLSLAATTISGSIWPLALALTRLLAVPGQMTSYFYDFFSSHPTYELSRSFLRWFNTSPYDVDPPFLIGAVYLDSPATSANANLWADAMANFGLLGIVPFTLVLGGVLWILDSVAANRDMRAIGPTLGLAGITLGNAGLFTSILTLGLGLTIVLVALMPQARVTPRPPRAMPRAP